MKVIALEYPAESCRSEGSAECECHLPELECEHCGESWCETEVWYPSLSLAAKADRSEFDQDKTVGLAELNRLRKQLVGPRKRGLRLVPGAGIGTVKAKLPGAPTDFVWCGFRLLARRRALEAMRADGVVLPHGPATVKSSKTRDDYVALELDSIPMWDELTLKQTTLVYCSVCGGFSMKDVRANLGGVKRYVRCRMPRRQGLVRVNEAYTTLATDAFVHSFRTHGMSGVEFKEEGVYV